MAETKTIAIIGGGLAGLTAAAWLARAGKSVTVFEKTRAVGGRALTETRGGFSFNLGPHALYAQGAAARTMRELGLVLNGRRPPLTGGYALAGGAKHTLPAGFVSMLTTGVLGLTAKFEAMRLLSTLDRLDAQALHHVTVRDWLEQTVQQPQTRQLVEAFLRVSTYAHDPERMSAGVAIAQLQLALASGVLYLDDGWQALVEQLRQAAAQAGARFMTGARVVKLEHAGAVEAVQLAQGERVPVSAAILATSPAEAAALVEHDGAGNLHTLASAALPVKAACLDVALERLPEPSALFGLGFDRPFYFSVHSATARLAPAGGALIHVMKYLGATHPDAHAAERELEVVLDLLQPGWRAVLRERRYLPSLTVAHALPTAQQGGLAGRPKPEDTGVRGVFIAGDWVGGEGLLADASVASGKRAAELILQKQTLAALAA